MTSRGAPVDTAASRRRRRRTAVVIATVVTGGLIVLVAALRWPTSALPGDEVRSVDPQVQSLYERSRAAVRSQPESASAWGDLGLVLAAHGHEGPAVACLARAASLDPRDWTWPCLGAALEAGTGDPETACTTIQEAIRRDPRQLWPRLLEARWFEMLDRGEEAGRLYRDLLAESPDHALASLGFSRVLLAAGSPEEAAAALSPALSNPATQRGAHELLARIEGRRGDESAAQAAAAAALSMPADPPWPDDPLPPALAARRVGKRDLPERIVALEQAGDERHARELSAALVAGHPEIALLLQGREFLARGEPRRAEEAFHAALARDVRSIEIAHALGTAIAAQGRLDEAADVFRSVIAVEPSYVRAWRDLADCLEATDPVAARAARSTAAAYARGTPPGTDP